MLDCWKDLISLTGRLHDLCAVAPEVAGQLTLAQARAVKIIYLRAPEPVILKDVAAELGITPSAASQMVDVLVRQNLVERLPSPTDRRAVLLRPTERGERFRKEHDCKMASLMSSLGGAVDDAEAAVFAKVLARLRAEADALWFGRESGEQRNTPAETPSGAERENEANILQKNSK